MRRGGPETPPAPEGEGCQAGHLAPVLLCQPVKLLPVTVGTEEDWQEKAHWDPVLKAG